MEGNETNEFQGHFADWPIRKASFSMQRQSSSHDGMWCALFLYKFQIRPGGEGGKWGHLAEYNDYNYLVLLYV